MTIAFLILAILGATGAITVGQWAFRKFVQHKPSVEEMLEKLLGNSLAPPPGVASPDTTSLIEPATQRTRRLLGEAVGLQKQHREREAIDRLLTAYDMELPPRARATLHLLAGNGYARLSDYPAAEGEFREVLRIGREANDALIQSAALGNLAALLTEKGERNLALPLLEEAIRLNGNLGNAEYVASDLNTQGLILRDLGRFADSQRSFSEALAIHQRLAT